MSTRGSTLFVVTVLALAACASAPVQEMSDARQAIWSAEASGAARRAPNTLQAAWILLQKAQAHLETGAYEDARRYALDARDEAIKAREDAVRNTAVRPESP
ncbi:DUF4398 domain-containing protein [Candidatus Competibacter phosphatis]|nr:DUF4398 domain-containing protein [Candidatus Competibacter phosphatis]